jgi:hypothetical protein
MAPQMLNAGHPFLTGMTSANGHVAEGLGTLLSEWQHFVACRDLLLYRRLAESASPQDVAGVFMDFWRKAAADYWQEYATMNKLATGIAGKIMSQAEAVSPEVTRTTSVARAA